MEVHVPQGEGTVSGIVSGCYPLTVVGQIRTHEDVYLWVNTTLIPNLYSGEWYNWQALTSWREAQQTRDRNTIRLGIARLRQLRIKDGEQFTLNQGPFTLNRTFHSVVAADLGN